MTYANAERVNTLIGMLAYCRPAGARGERRFIHEFVTPLGVSQDAAGNLIKRIGTAPIMYSCHTDTVHKQGGRQHLAIDHGIAKLACDSASSCLGADDTAGVWLMRELILAKRPGLYVFHRGEEIGGIGSQHIADNTPELLDGIEAAIALDRKGKNSVVTHQWGGRCASDAFAASIAGHIGGAYAADNGGTFTDTANYIEIVPECTNLSVGYEHCHTPKETLDLPFLLTLREALLDLNINTLCIERDPAEIDPNDYTLDWMAGSDMYAARGPWSHLNNDNEPRGRANLFTLIRDHPAETADFLESYGVNADDLADAILQRGAAMRL